MATKKIKGITIELGADTSKFVKAINDVDKSLKSTQSSLKDVNKLLKIDPSNTEMLKQKQELLNSAISDTKDRLNTLKGAYDQLKNADNASEAAEQQKALAREIVETEQKLKSLKKEYRDFGSVAKQQLQATSVKLQQYADKLEGVGTKMTATLTVPILALGGIGVKYNADMQQYETMLTTLTGSADEADRIIKNIQADASKSPFDTSTLIQANQYLISAGVNADEASKTINDLGNAVAATGGGSDELNRMALNLQQIKNVGKASSVDIKQFAMAGINIYGLLADVTGKTTEEVKDMEVSYELLAEALALASEEGGRYYGAMEAQSQTINGSMSTLKDSISQLLGSITESLTPIIVDVVNKLKEVIEWLNSLDEDTKKTILTVGLVVAAIGPLILVITKIISGISLLLNTISFLFTPVGAIVLAIGAVVTAGVLLYKNWDTIKEKAHNLWSSITQTFNDIKDGISRAMEGAKTTVSNAIDRIKGFFNFSWELPKLKLPHFSVSGKFGWSWSGGLSVPHVSVDWYKKAMNNGMILNNPTIFGAMDGKLLGAGEAGSETIVGTNSLMNMIRQASQGTIINMTINAQDQNVYELADIVMDRIVAVTKAERKVFQ